MRKGRTAKKSRFSRKVGVSGGRVRNRSVKSRSRKLRGGLAAGYTLYASSQEINDSLKELKEGEKTAVLFKDVPLEGQKVWSTFDNSSPRDIARRAILKNYLAKTRGPQATISKYTTAASAAASRLNSEYNPYSTVNVENRASARTTLGLNYFCNAPAEVERIFTSGTLGKVELTARQRGVLLGMKTVVAPSCTENYRINYAIEPSTKKD